MRVPPGTGQLVAPRAHPPARPATLDRPPTDRLEDAMFQRATRLIGRARERIRAADEQDPFAWPDTRVVLVMDDDVHGHLEPDRNPPDDGGLEDAGAPAVPRVEAPAPGDGGADDGAEPRADKGPAT